MGAAASSCTNGNGCFGINESDEVRLSRGIDKGLRETRRTLANTSKVLLLGAGDSGKSTIIKQMRIINSVPFTEYEREIYRVQLFYNLVGGMRAILDALRDLPPLEEGDTIDANGVVIKANPPANRNSTANGGGGGDKKLEDAGNGAEPSNPLPKFTNMDLAIAQSSEDDDEEDDSRTSSPAPRPSKITPGDQRPKSTVLNPTTSTTLPTRSDATTEAHPTPNDQNLSTLLDTNNNNGNNNNDSNDPNRPPSRTPTRSPSISLNLFNPGSLTPRQLTLLNEFMYAPDLRPGQPFPLEFESMLREAWWGLTDEEWEQQQHQQQQLQRSQSQRGSQYVPNSPMGESHRARGRNTYHHQEEVRTSQYMSRERRGAGSMLDRIERESGIALPDNLGYLYANPERLASFFEEDYMPSDDDILRCRCRTTGIQETVFSLGKALMGPNVRRKGSLGNIAFKGGGQQSSSNPTRSDPSSSDIQRQNTDLNRGESPDPVPLKISVGKTKLHMVDVGGQRSERRKWIHCFQDVTAVLFLVGLSGYNQGLVEDPTANQMQDAMALWDGVCSSPWLKNTSLILFLNKTDLFAQKIGKFPISDYFPDYEGEKGDAKAGMDYFRKRFVRVAAKSIRAARQSQARSRKDSRAVTTDSSTVVGSTNSRSKSKHRDDSKFGARSNNKDESGHIATNTTSSHGVAALSFDSPRRPVGLSSSTSRIPSGSGSGSGVGATTSSGSRGGEGDGERRGKKKEVQRERTVYTHFTNATDTSQLRVVIVAVCDIILRDNFAQANLI